MNHKIKQRKDNCSYQNQRNDPAAYNLSNTLFLRLFSGNRSCKSGCFLYTLGRMRNLCLTLLRRALDGGEISMIEYFVEVSVVYQSQANLLTLECQYQKAMARLYRSRL